MSLALATVLFEWRRYLAAVAALAFSGLLILAQVGMFTGMGKAFSASIDRSRAELFVLPAKADSLMRSGGLPRRVMPLLYLDPAVVQVNDIEDGGGQFSNIGAGGRKVREYVDIGAIDTDRTALTLPTDFSEKVRLALSVPYSVAIDRTSLGELGVKLGDKAAVDGRAVTVGAVLDGYPSLGSNPKIYASRQTLLLIGKTPPSDRVGPLLVKINRPSAALLVRDRLNKFAAGRFRVWTKAELSAANESAFMQVQIIGIMLGFSVLLGVGIGVGITSQTLSGAVLGNIKEFASLRALGVSIRSLMVIVMELSFWVGLAGLAATAILVFAVAELARSAGIPMAFPASYVVLVAALLLTIAIVSGALAIGVLRKSQPADLLR